MFSSLAKGCLSANKALISQAPKAASSGRLYRYLDCPRQWSCALCKLRVSIHFFRESSPNYKPSIVNRAPHKLTVVGEPYSSGHLLTAFLSSSNLFDRAPRATNLQPCHKFRLKHAQNPFNQASRLQMRFKPVGSEASLERFQNGEGTWMSSRGWGIPGGGGVQRGRCGRWWRRPPRRRLGTAPRRCPAWPFRDVARRVLGVGIPSFPVAGVPIMLSVGSGRREKNTEKNSCFSGCIFGLGQCWWLVPCGPWTFSGWRRKPGKSAVGEWRG